MLSKNKGHCACLFFGGAFYFDYCIYWLDFLLDGTRKQCNQNLSEYYNRHQAKVLEIEANERNES